MATAKKAATKTTTKKPAAQESVAVIAEDVTVEATNFKITASTEANQATEYTLAEMQTIRHQEQAAIVSPLDVIELGMIEFPEGIEDRDQYIQQNGIDISCDTMTLIEKDNFILTKDGVTKHRNTEQVPVDEFNVEGVDRPLKMFEMMPGFSYQFGSDFKINVKPGYSAMLVVRSSLNRNAILATSGWWDTGYQGTVGGVLHNHSGLSHIEVGARVAQIVFFKSDSAKTYNGQYQGL